MKPVLTNEEIVAAAASEQFLLLLDENECTELGRLIESAVLAKVEPLLIDALTRMDRARAILTENNPRPDCNWGMLDTSDIRVALGEK